MQKKKKVMWKENYDKKVQDVGRCQIKKKIFFSSDNRLKMQECWMLVWVKF